MCMAFSFSSNFSTKDFGGIWHLFVVVEEYFLADYFCYEEACGFIGQCVFAEEGGALWQTFFYEVFEVVDVEV